jgi:inorganic triphosphatase YgiF
MQAAREVELKLHLPAEARATVLGAPALHAVQAGRPTRRRLLALYFDTADAALARAGLALRLRKGGRRWVQTLKGPAESGSGSGIASRLELECDRGTGARPPALDTTQWAATPWQRLLARAEQRGLAARFATDYTRIEVPVALPGGTRASMCVDVGEARDGKGGAAPISEIEVELDHGSVDAVYRFAQALATELPLRIETRSKAERGYALLHRATRTPARAQHASLEESDSTAGALQSLLRACLRQIADNADGTLQEDDPEWIHQLRVGTRRLRACLALLRDAVPEEARATVAADAQWLARALGPARDLDVLADETLPSLRKALRDGHDAAELRALSAFSRRVRMARTEARAAARAAVASPRFTRLLLATGTLAATPWLGAAEGTPARRALAAPARSFARPWLARRHRKLVQRARGLAHASIEERHQVRIAAKRLRYAAEFFADLFPRRLARQYRQALTRLQDALGAQIDLQVALRLAFAIEGQDSPVARILQAYIAQGDPAMRARIARRWRSFRKCRPFFAGH